LWVLKIFSLIFTPPKKSKVFGVKGLFTKSPLRSARQGLAENKKQRKAKL